MGAMVNRIDPGASSRQHLAQPPVQNFEIGGGDQSLGNTALVAHDNHSKAGMVELCDRLGRAGKNLHLFPPGHVLTLPGFAVNYAVTIEKRSSHNEKSFVRQAVQRRGQLECGTPGYAGFRSRAHKYSNPLRS